jgi:NADH:ubiquinone oxidoreductase subunit C
MTVNSAYVELQKLSMEVEEKSYTQPNEKQVILSAEKLLPAIKILQENDIYHLSTITGIYDQGHLCLLYHFWKEEGITLRIPIVDEKSSVATLTRIIPGALFYEREVAEMFGIQIDGLDTSVKMFLPDNWEGGAPMQKEFAESPAEEKMED